MINYKEKKIDYSVIFCVLSWKKIEMETQTLKVVEIM